MVGPDVDDFCGGSNEGGLLCVLNHTSEVDDSIPSLKVSER